MTSAEHAQSLRRLAARRKFEGEIEAAEAALREALAAAPGDPRTEVLLSEVLLAQGRYREAWPLTEGRLEIGALGSARPPLEEPEWRGEPIGGKRLLIVGEQGAGDQIMYGRFAPRLQAAGATVMLLCMASLTRLFETSLGVSVFPMQGRVDLPDPDLWVMAASIPARLGISPETVPGDPYLHAPPRSLGARIGVMGRGNPRHAYDAYRSLPDEQAERLLARPGAISLAPDVTGASDFYDTAQVIAGLDLVISVDTSIAHLAGALGKPVWILLSALGVDWRWMERRLDSPWYPSASLIRQPAPGRWDLVIDEVEHALEERGL